MAYFELCNLNLSFSIFEKRFFILNTHYHQIAFLICLRLYCCIYIQPAQFENRGASVNMDSGNIVNSLKVDRTCTAFGLPWFAPGKQPTVLKDDAFGIAGLSDVLEKLDKIFHVS